jgi:hypothetical protein
LAFQTWLTTITYIHYHLIMCKIAFACTSQDNG